MPDDKSQLSIFSGSSTRRSQGLGTGDGCGPVKSCCTENQNHVFVDRALCAEAAMLEQNKIFFEARNGLNSIINLWGIDFVRICLFTKPEKQIYLFLFMYFKFLQFVTIQ